MPSKPIAITQDAAALRCAGRSHRTLRKSMSGALLALAACLAMGLPVAADAAPWGDRRFVYKADAKPLREVLEEFAASQGLPVSVDPGVEGRVSATFNNSPDEFLATVSKAYGLVWYYDRTSLFIYPSRAMQSRIFRLRGASRERVRELMQSLEVGDSRFPLRVNEAQQTLMAYGPPRHIEIVTALVDSLEQGYREDGAHSVRVFPLRYAVAADRKFGSQVTRGMAGLLTDLFAEAQGSSPSATGIPLGTDGGGGAGSAERAKPMEQLYGGTAKRRSGESSRQSGPVGTMFAPAANPAHTGTLVFQADEGNNAVVVKGPIDRMVEIERVIKQLDRPQAMVEIEAAIIDVNTEALASLGVNWDFSDGKGSQVTVAPVAPGFTPGTVTQMVPGALNITTLVSDAGRRLLANIRALEGTGQARIVARPKVLGTVNRTATMVDKRVASVRVAGNLDANLFSIEAGTTMQVLPQLVPAQGGVREVKLTLFIQDGNFETATVDQVPVIKRTEINTEATIREGESLLLGGISVETETKGASGVPGLSRLPLVGGLFKVNDTRSSRRERLFLLTPKVLGASPTAAALPFVVPPSAERIKPVPVPVQPNTLKPDEEQAPTAPAPGSSASPSAAAATAPAPVRYRSRADQLREERGLPPLTPAEPVAEPEPAKPVAVEPAPAPPIAPRTISIPVENKAPRKEPRAVAAPDRSASKAAPAPRAATARSSRPNTAQPAPMPMVLPAANPYQNLRIQVTPVTVRRSPSSDPAIVKVSHTTLHSEVRK